MLDEPELPEHEVQEPEDEYEKGKPRHNLFKTRSVQDTICSRHNLSRHISQDTICSRHDLLSEIQPMSTSPAPVIEYVASVSAITYTALSPVTEYVAPAPVVTYAAASWDIDYVSHSN